MGVRDPAGRVRLIRNVLTVLLLAAFFVGCRTGGRSAGGEQLLVVTADVGMRFGGRVPGPTLRVRTGRPVRLVLENRDRLQHDLWVVGPRERAPYLEPAFPGAKTRVLGPGEREEIRFVADRPGRYRYVCTVPGHDVTMYGEFVVEE
ncbi:MAG: plastocyanin/azurin family copper-binding protein [Armatimonadota bacterium]|nr:plastocyanin/azurin family copper-binding protein [Armatimonadota bacterium]MDR7444279.1 plastocyanin/azurin family copper-binding protein [Armatimonadota bacterium]MDR7570914.1 plastocyanin/azurin family copper-binding protein [Armatimonadota bacterium]MDR7614188.1 plastocyanin/azurin family copper-binding protein [Armatimonadota bacterium]